MLIAFAAARLAKNLPNLVDSRMGERCGSGEMGCGYSTAIRLLGVLIFPCLDNRPVVMNGLRWLATNDVIFERGRAVRCIFARRFSLFTVQSGDSPPGCRSGRPSPFLRTGAAKEPKPKECASRSRSREPAEVEREFSGTRGAYVNLMRRRSGEEGSRYLRTASGQLSRSGTAW